LHLAKIDEVSLPGNPGKPNEDSFGLTHAAACVFDGATGLGEALMPGPSDARWLATFAARRFCAHAERGNGGIREWLRATAGEAEHGFVALRRREPRENYEIPYASAVLAAVDGPSLRVLWFGDCALLLRDPAGRFSVFGDFLAKREGERVRAGRLTHGRSAGAADATVRDEFLPALRASRNLVNTGDEWLFAPDVRCAAHAKSAEVVIVPGTMLLLASDGLLALASDYELYTPEALLAAAETAGLKKLTDELRIVETADAGGVKYPRFKTSDDATGLLLRVAAAG
jgi:serine/threonine protein phosphatase PrpC